VSRPVFSFRPKLDDPAHRRAWETLQRVPEGQKNAFLVQVILQSEDAGKLEGLLRKVIREELERLPPVAAERVAKEEKPEGIPAEMLDFLSSMDEQQ
jgi:hypothetical protein